MIPCWACGTEIRPSDGYCSSCGAPASLYSEPCCQACSGRLPPSAAFCPNCGEAVSGTTKTAYPDKPESNVHEEPQELSASMAAESKMHNPINKGPRFTRWAYALLTLFAIIAVYLISNFDHSSYTNADKSKTNNTSDGVTASNLRVPSKVALRAETVYRAPRKIATSAHLCEI